MAMNYLKVAVFSTYLNFSNDMNYDGLHKVRMSRKFACQNCKIPNPKRENYRFCLIPLC